MARIGRRAILRIGMRGLLVRSRLSWQSLQRLRHLHALAPLSATAYPGAPGSLRAAASRRIIVIASALLLTPSFRMTLCM
jgi:hypothetical protein